MKTQMMTRFITAVLATSILGACSKGFESTQQSSSTPGTNNSQSTAPAAPTGPSEFEKMDLNTYVTGGAYEKEQVVSLDKANNALLLYLPLPASDVFISINADIAKLPGAKIRTVLDAQQKARIVISIPLKYIVKGKITTLPSATTLPGGRDLPMMPSGEYPSVGLSLNNQSDNKIYLYLGVNAVGLFLESSFFPPYLSVAVKIRNKAGTKDMGFFTIVPKDGVNNGGLFLSFLMPKDLATIIDDHLGGLIN